MKIEIERNVVEKAHQALSLLALKFMSSVDEKSWAASTSAINALAEALAAPQNQLADINVADMAAPNSVEFDGIETQPAHRGPVATFDEVFDAIDWDVWRMQPIRELVRMIHGKTAPQPATQQAPDALHLAAMDLARKQMDRIADLEAEVARFRADAMNEKAARQALEQQLAARVPLTDGEWFKFWGNCDEIPGDSVYPEFLELARIVEAYYGIQKDPA